MNAELLLEHFDRIAEAPDAILRLRRFIWDLAVRGKLVEQDSNESADEDLRKVSGNGLLDQAIEGSYDIPSSWRWIRLDDAVTKHLGGGTPSKAVADYWDGEIFWASVKDIGHSKFVDRTVDRISEEGLRNSSSNLIPPESLIVVTRMGLGKVSINQVPIAINQDLRALFLPSGANVEYYYFFFKTADVQGTGLTVKGIRLAELMGMPFPFPPLAEQHRIVAKVNELMAICDDLAARQQAREAQRDRLVMAVSRGLVDDVDDPETMVDRTQFYLGHFSELTVRREHVGRLRQMILDLAVRGKLVEQNSEDEPVQTLLQQVSATNGKFDGFVLNNVPFAVPPSWKWVKLGSVTRVVMGQSPPGDTYNFILRAGHSFRFW